VHCIPDLHLTNANFDHSMMISMMMMIMIMIVITITIIWDVTKIALLNYLMI